MKKRISNLLESLNNPQALLLILFGIEGIFLQFDTSINSYGNNLFATNMGATDSQIGMNQMIPNLVACIALLPLGILSDRLKSSKTVPLVTLLAMSAGYFCFATVPALDPSIRMTLYFIFLAFTAGGLAIYNAQWQAFFGDVASMEQRNTVFTFRNRFMFVIGIAAPILCGVLMGLSADASGKLMVLRCFYYVAGAFTLMQAFVIHRIPGGQRSPEVMAELSAKRFSVADVGTTIRTTMSDRQFLLFFLPVVLFYMSWHMDWSMWYIGETKYCNMNETALSIYSGVFNVGQLIAIGFIANMVRKRSADYTFVLAVAGLVFMPIVMLFVPHLPAGARPVTFTILVTVLNAPQCAVNLCVVQMLLAAAPERNRSLVVSLYTMVVTLSNSLMPWLGVQLYTALGGDLNAFYLFNAIELVARGAVLVLFVWRYRFVKRQGKLIKA